MEIEDLVDKIVKLILKIEGIEENGTLRNHVRTLSDERLNDEYNSLKNLSEQLDL